MFFSAEAKYFWNSSQKEEELLLIDLAFGDVIELRLHPGGIGNVHGFGEGLLKLDDGQVALLCGKKGPF